MRRMGEQMLENLRENLMRGSGNLSGRVKIGDRKECKLWFGSRGKLVIVGDVVRRKLVFFLIFFWW